MAKPRTSEPKAVHPEVRLTVADFGDAETERLDLSQVPTPPDDAEPYEAHGCTVWDGQIDGTPRRWRRRNGRLVTYLEYWPDSQERLKTGKSPFRRMFTAS